MKVLFLTNVPSPYRVAFFNELGKLCDLTVLFEKDTSDERDESWRQYAFQTFKGIVLKGRSVRVDAAFCPDVLKHVRDRSYDEIICTNVASPTGMLAILYMKLSGISYWIEGDGAFAKSGKGLKEAVKRFFISGAKGYFSTSAEHDRYYLTYGAKAERICRYPFTSLYEKDILPNVPDAQEKADIRKQLGIEEQKVVLAVGRFVTGKGFDVLLRAAGNLPREIGFYFVGGTATEEYLTLKEELQLQKNVHFVGFCMKDQLSRYFKAADVFVLPTRGDVWGLVINEAMAHGLPVISTERCIAALELIREGENGYIIPVDDRAAMEKGIRSLLDDPELCRRGAEVSLSVVAKYTIERMASEHLRIMEDAAR